MSADGFRWRTVDQDDSPALFGVDELVTPVRGTGRMSDLEFLPVTAKRILNHVPSGSRAPSDWTINVYRGCSHACVYCLSGDTPILMADGRTKPISEVRAGDRVHGTVRVGAYRRYTITDVYDQWRTVSRAYRVTLADGTSIVCGEDHRFLTERGWKFASPSRPGGQRPHLTTTNSLLGFGSLGAPPVIDDDYRRGYLTGMVRGDANLKVYDYDRPGRTHGRVHRFRLALADAEALDRTRDYLVGFGVRTTTFDFSPSTTTRRHMTAIRTSAKAAFDTITHVIEWPDRVTDSWRRGFLAGIFDAEGSHSTGNLRIANSDEEILTWTMDAARALGFTVAREAARANGVSNVRVAGGLHERLRFLQTCDPAITRKRCIDGTAIKSAADLRVISIEDLGLALPMFDLTTGTGDFVADGVVSHNCFARPTHEYLGLDSGRDFDTKIVVKINAVEKLRAELAAPSWRNDRVAMGTNTDPYQRAEAKYRLTRGVLEALADHGTPFSILTKSPLVTRDLDVLLRARQRADVEVNFSIGTLDQRVWRASEPGTPNPRRRVAAMAELARAGIRTGALVAPVLPGLSDRPEQLREVVDAVRGAGGRLLGLGALYLRPGVKEHVLDWLERELPDLHDDWARRYAGSAYAPPRYLDELHRRAGVARGSVRGPAPRPGSGSEAPGVA